MLVEEGQTKFRTLSTDLRVIEKPATFKIKFQNLSRKPRQKHIIIEKERLYDENLQLKQLTNSLQDENLRLKTRLLHFENDVRKPFEKEFKSSNLVNSLKFQIKTLKEKIEKMQVEYHELKASVKATRVNELEEEAKQYFNECWRLKKIIDEGFKGKILSSPNQSRTDLIDKIKEQAGEIENLKSENSVLKSKFEKSIKDMQSIKKELNYSQSELNNTKLELQKIQDSQNAKNEMLESLIQKEESKESLVPPAARFRRAETKIKEKNLDRELGNNPEVILDRFFKNLSLQINNKYLSNEEFLAIIDPESISKVDLNKLPGIFQANGFNFSLNELKAVYSILSAQGQIIPASIIMNALDAVDNDSSKSYDISSESSFGNNFVGNTLAVAKISDVELDQIEEVLDYLYTSLSFQGFNTEKFKKFLTEKLPEPVNLANLAKLFLEKTCRIEEGVERNKVCSYLLAKHECLSKDAVVDKIIEIVFKDYPEDVQENEKSFKQVMLELADKKQEFIEKCQEIDKNDKGWLGWKMIENVVKEILGELNNLGLLQLKIKSFGIEKSLNIIPYSSIFELI